MRNLARPAVWEGRRAGSWELAQHNEPHRFEDPLGGKNGLPPPDDGQARGGRGQ